MPSNFYSLFSRFIRRFRQALPPEFGTTLSVVRDRKLSFRKMRFGCFSPIAQSNFVNTFSSRLIDKSCLYRRLRSDSASENVRRRFFFPVRTKRHGRSKSSRSFREPYFRRSLRAICGASAAESTVLSGSVLFRKKICVRAGDLQSRRPIRFFLHRGVAGKTSRSGATILCSRNPCSSCNLFDRNRCESNSACNGNHRCDWRTFLRYI